mmetsp:Transcript_130893/g.330460  ORF Transcript_130893/g.330460 Transcript_130893/m.330460 type:complete len:108 (+) Transcript_130893:343-666(+)
MWSESALVAVAPVAAMVGAKTEGGTSLGAGFRGTPLPEKRSVTISEPGGDAVADGDGDDDGAGDRGGEGCGGTMANSGCGDSPVDSEVVNAGQPSAAPLEDDPSSSG